MAGKDVCAAETETVAGEDKVSETACLHRPRQVQWGKGQY